MRYRAHLFIINKILYTTYTRPHAPLKGGCVYVSLADAATGQSAESLSLSHHGHMRARETSHTAARFGDGWVLDEVLDGPGWPEPAAATRLRDGWVPDEVLDGPGWLEPAATRLTDGWMPDEVLDGPGWPEPVAAAGLRDG